MWLTRITLKTNLANDKKSIVYFQRYGKGRIKNHHETRC